MLTLFSFLLLFCLPLTAAAITVELPRSGIVASELAVIVNDRDPLSVKIAEYYQQKRNIPAENIIHIAFPATKSKINPGEFTLLKMKVEAKTPAHIQAYLLTWSAPYQVGCMSISSAFALGYDRKYCAKGCQATHPVRYSGSSSTAPFTDFGIRPTMLLAATDFQQARALIDRGVAADGRSYSQRGSAYLVETPDKNRSVRKVFFLRAKQLFSNTLPVYIVKARAIIDKKDIMFYFTGDIFVEDIDTNHFLPGAMADHLTSTGGRLDNKRQMSALRWLEAGATGSYGTVVEPCNLLGKFPNPLLAMQYYLQGQTLLEAYWKSVKMPGQGLFIGEPLAKPYASYHLQSTGKGLALRSPVFRHGKYTIFAADNADGPLHLIQEQQLIRGNKAFITLSRPYSAFYKIVRLQ